jgi:predicted nucleic acid-binding protein
MIIVSDTSVITNLYQIGQLDILEELFSEIVIPQGVYEELEKLPEQKIQIDAINWITIREIKDEARYLQLRKTLDRGESESIVLAIELQADALLIDEKKGRKIARELGVEVTGLLGVLLEAKLEGIIEAIKPLMDDLIYQAEFRISPRLYKDILDKAME